MLSSINPLGERARGHRFGTTVLYYLAGSVLGGAIMGGLAGTLGALTLLGMGMQSRLWVFAVAAATAAALEWRGAPSWHRQVNEDWLSLYRRWVYAAGYGVQLGSGFATTVSTAGVYLWLLAALVLASPPASALVGASFGLARAAPIFAVWPRESAAELRELHRRLISFGGFSRRVSIAALGALAVVAALGGILH